MFDDLRDEWVVIPAECAQCGCAIRLVATQRSIDEGTCESLNKPEIVCQVCLNTPTLVMN